MNKKQKKVLKRIIVAAVLLVIIGIAGSVVSIPKWLEFLFYLVPYFVIGYDILRKAWKGICNRQMFDENFLMAVATIGAIALGGPGPASILRIHRRWLRSGTPSGRNSPSGSSSKGRFLPGCERTPAVGWRTG